VARGGLGAAAEHWIVERIRALPGWDAHNANESRFNQPGFDVLAINAAGRRIRVSVKSVSTGGTRHDYGIGRSFARHDSRHEEEAEEPRLPLDATGASRGTPSQRTMSNGARHAADETALTPASSRVELQVWASGTDPLRPPSILRQPPLPRRQGG
jgi:hypothetical protein